MVQELCGQLTHAKDRAMIPATSRNARWDMDSAVSPGLVFRFGLFEADVGRHRLTRKGVPVKIQDKPFQVLILLLQKPGEIISREELRRALWPEGTYVDFDGSLNVILKKLRAAINEDSDNPRFIETVPRRGYRFIAPVWVDEGPPVAEAAHSIKFGSTSANSGFSIPSARMKYWKMPAVAVLVLLMAATGWWYFLRYHSTVQASRKVIAVLPFANEGAGADFDYLRYAIPNDLVTDLTYARSMSVRPFASTAKYAAEPFDPAAVGKDLRVTHVLTGGFLRDQKGLRVSMELIEVAQNQTVWRDEITVAPQEMIALHDKLAASTGQRLLPTINVTDFLPNNLPTPRNEQAFDLFQHSVAMPLDPGPNQNAIHALEQSVALDSGYAPAWSQLGWRYYIDFHYGSGGEEARVRSLEAAKRDSELDPSSPPVSTTIRSEEGDLSGAYTQAADFLRRRPDASMAHFWMSYVFRYAGLLDESSKECDAALALDPGFNVFRSCGSTFIMEGDYAHAQRYINVDEGSGFAAIMRMQIALRTRNTAAALAAADAAGQHGYQSADARLVRACLSHPPATGLAKAVAELENDPVSARDHELLYQNADAAAFCGQPEAALRELRKAVQGNYCSYPAMDKDPLFEPIRQRSEFAELQAAGMRCQQSFLAHRKQFDTR